MPSDAEIARCAVCGWPLAATAKDGCVAGNCAMRPRPRTLYDAERAAAERAGEAPRRQGEIAQAEQENRVSDDISIPLEAGAYAFGEPAVARVVGHGAQAHVWVGLANRNASCLGVLHGKDLDRLLAAVAARKGGDAARRNAPDLGRTAEPKKAFRPDGRRRG